MGKVDINAEGVRATMATVSTSYSTLKQLIQETLAKKENITNFWEAAEATTFANDLETLSGSFDKFFAQHENILSSMEHMMAAVDDLEANQANAMHTYGGAGGSN